MLKKVAITGNIASGKSQVEKVLAENFPVYDTDKIAHQILDELDGFFGYDVLTDGKIDRQKLGRLVFENKELKQKLERIIHPKVKEKILELFEKHQNDKLIFISVPLLFEAGFEGLFDEILFISVDESIQLERLMSRNNLTKKEALSRINSQQKQEEKIKKSDYIINNNGSIEELKKLVIEYINNVTKNNQIPSPLEGEG